MSGRGDHKDMFSIFFMNDKSLKKKVFDMGKIVLKKNNNIKILTWGAECVNL
jgi:hypothetical protein